LKEVKCGSTWEVEIGEIVSSRLTGLKKRTGKEKKTEGGSHPSVHQWMNR
jgi:hypothetical protein